MAGRVTKSSDIPDAHVIELARAWQADYSRPSVVRALVAEGVHPKIAYAKVEKLCRRGLMEYGTSPAGAWPTEKADLEFPP